MSSAAAPDWIAVPSRVVAALPSPDGAAISRELSLSAWSRSRWKRSFDVACCVGSLPLLLPLLAAIALLVRCTSAGPVLFRQVRMGRGGRAFAILKFRTMVDALEPEIYPLTTSSHPRLTPVGRFLRRTKLDELPQVFNVIAGHMSLVGPRPRPPLHDPEPLACRPGITGAATLAFAREEVLLDRVPKAELSDYYFSVVLPVKRGLDDAYMKIATLRSDLKLILKSMCGRWDDSPEEIWELDRA